MLDNIKLNKTDDELRQLPDVVLVAKLSILSYWSSILGVAFWGGWTIFLYGYYEQMVHSVLNVLGNASAQKIWTTLGINSQVMSALNTLGVYPEYVAIAIILFGIVMSIPSVLHILRCYYTTLIVDSGGVWLKKGLFAFTREVHGIVWKNADLASSRNNLVYHWTGSYPIQICNRYSGVMEIDSLPIQEGKKVIGVINRKISDTQSNSN